MTLELNRSDCSNSVRYGLLPELGRPHDAPAGPAGPQNSATELAESGGCEVTVKSKRISNSQRSHEGEARGVDKRILALVVATKPTQSGSLHIFRDNDEPKSR